MRCDTCGGPAIVSTGTGIYCEEHMPDPGDPAGIDDAYLDEQDREEAEFWASLDDEDRESMFYELDDEGRSDARWGS